MKLRLKELSLGAGRPVAFINEKDAKDINVHVGDRIEIASNGKKIIAIVDIVKKFIARGEISLSEEIVEYLKIRKGSLVDVDLTIGPRSSILIAKKLSGQALNKEEIYLIVKDIVDNALTEAEIAYFVSGVYDKGMTFEETVYLTGAMYKTGEMINWHTKNIADKHSIGGIAGNRTTPIVVSICASLGVVMPKTSSRAITSAAGTADVIETLANVDFPVKKLKEIVKKTGACLAWGGALGLAPVDDKLIRVERLLNLDPESQLIASILAKKLAVGSKYVLIDIPYGKYAKVTREKAIKLKKKFIRVGNHFKLKMDVVLTDGSQPIGNGIGPILEMQDVIRVLKRENSPKDLENKSIFLAAKILEMVSKAKKGEGEQMAREALYSGRAFRKFEEIISAQGKRFIDLKPAKFKLDIRAKRSGKIFGIDNKAINLLGRILGCPVDKAAGLYIYCHNSDNVKKGDKLVTLYSESEKKLAEAAKFLSETKPIKIK
ncbi:MAG TPA: AMP phosphorylase [Candidatus Nanoarchaeia archaeon]|nr:AMP phosphorylase [Candidatus Nanoarchaeia archaeon]